MSGPAAALSGLLRERTAAAHTQAEQSPFLGALVQGRVTGPGLAALLGRLAPVYDALETASARWATDARLGRFVLPELHRTARLRADLVHLTGGADVPVSAASAAYAARVEHVSRTGAAEFLAHHYTRYLGDLSGGQVLGAAVRRSLGLTDGAGASFFAFPGVRAGALTREYRKGLDRLRFSRSERAQLVDEALVAYRLNVELVGELDGDLERWTTS